MIFVYLFFLFVGIVVFILASKFSFFLRFVIAFAVFIVPSISVTWWLIKVGDKPPPDAITVMPDDTGKLQAETGGNEGKRKH